MRNVILALLALAVCQLTAYAGLSTPYDAYLGTVRSVLAKVDGAGSGQICGPVFLQ